MIIQEIIIPSIFSDVANTKDSKKKTTALAILSRLYNLTSYPQIVEILTKLYEDEK